MERIEFTHNGDEYSVGALSEFQSTMASNIIADLAGGNVTNSRAQLIMYFVRWNIATRINGKAFSFLTDATEDRLSEFSELVASDNDLATKWLNAYKEANKEQTDPNASNAEPKPETE